MELGLALMVLAYSVVSTVNSTPFGFPATRTLDIYDQLCTIYVFSAIRPLHPKLEATPGPDPKPETC